MPQTPPELLRAALEWLPIGVLNVSPDGAIALVNRTIEHVFGYTAPISSAGRSRARSRSGAKPSDAGKMAPKD